MAYYRETARGQIRGDTTGRLKLVFHRDTRDVLGVHIIGEGAAELVHIGQAVMTLGGTMDYFIDTVFNYPTLAECYKAAAFNGLGRLNRYQSVIGRRPFASAESCMSSDSERLNDHRHRRRNYGTHRGRKDAGLTPHRQAHPLSRRHGRTGRSGAMPAANWSNCSPRKLKPYQATPSPSTPSASPFPASFATASSRTRPTSRR